MHDGAKGHVGKLEAVARLDVRFGPGNYLVSGGKPDGGQDVALFAVDVMEQGDMRGAVRVVFDAGDLGRDVYLIPPEVDDAEEPLVAAAALPGGHPAEVVSAAGSFQRFGKAFFRLGPRNFVERKVCLKPSAR